MKAIVVREFGAPDVMKVEDVPMPEPSPGQILVAISAAGVNPVDTYIRSGQYAKKPPLPYTPGIDGAGVVKSIGQGSTKFSVGAKVYLAGSISGTYAEYALCDESQAHSLPDRISFEQGAAIGVPYGVAYRALFHRALAQPGETVLIHGGTGGVGVAAIQLALAHGLKVIATAGKEDGLSFLSEQEALHVLNHRNPDHFEEIMSLTNGAGVDVILEMAANINLGHDLKILAYRGRVVVIGSRGPVEIDPRDAMARDASIFGILLFNASNEELARIHAALGAGFKNGTLTPIIGQKFLLTEAATAHKEIVGPHSIGKSVLIP
ncbi:MAG: NADPH:quinone reductase [Desulfomonilaceae bacterium]